MSDIRLNSEATKTIEDANQLKTEFYKKFLIPASSVRDEMLWRLGKTPEQAEREATALMSPIFRSPLPLSRALTVC
jgi:hypothetical protein